LATSRTFGVVVDRSSSMDERLLGRALDSVAAHAAARDVHNLRVAFCDAAAHDAGWLSPEQIASQVTVAGGQSTVLQPAVDLLLTDPHFPAGEPILLITDGRCDDVRMRRDHAWLTSGHLPFTPRGPVFLLA
jgi:predicted metal-dependent peptidase